MNATAYHLKARSPFHFGVRGVGVEATGVIAHTDTLFAALCLELREVAGAQRLEAFLASFPKDGVINHPPPLLLSSAFPYIQYIKDEPLRLYPKPVVPPPGFERNEDDDPQRRKHFKKISFLSETIFLAWIKGKPLSDYCNDEKKPYVLQDGQVWVSHEEWSELTTKMRTEEIHFWQTERMTRVVLDRASHASQVFDAERVYFKEGCGLWFVIRWLDESWKNELEDVLHVLADVGLGGERSAGHGQFSIQSSEINLPGDTGPLQMTLSVYHPTQAEVEQRGALDGEQVSYQLLTRRGWLGSPEGGGLRHKAVRMLAEGAVFQADGKSTYYGDLVDVTPSTFEKYPNWHPVYRYGLAFPIGVNHEQFTHEA